ncbi:L-idonate 5-dehydrogenase [Terriglobus albidus]|uniref:L-idonate 5-dehydrogenase n=1 Tax=Terriglobus albidus TaxID=1592106 RepID=UPI0021E0A7AC|nr:L-idonate 5-dehydrogenase [Terriglobus albidus]
MRACVIHGPLDLRVEERAVPEVGKAQVAVRLGAGGICGSDLHYFHDGRVGSFEVRQPMVLGHEVAGTVVAVGESVTELQAGTRVAVNPARPCLACRECLSGRANLCTDVRFYGSAARFPHVDGAFSEVFIAEESQCVAISDQLPFSVAACAEPLAVALHAVRRAGNLLGKRVLITGSGPIGLLTILCAKLAGAFEVTVTDQLDEPLSKAQLFGASRVVNITRERLVEDGFDVAIEAAGAIAALTTCLQHVRPGGRVVQLGSLPLTTTESLRLPTLVTREIELVGSFRFYEEYRMAVALLESRSIDLSPILTAEVPLERSIEAFNLASDRRRAIKVSLVP